MKTLDNVLEERRYFSRLYPPVPTGFVIPDGQTPLLRWGMLTLMAARPGMGKTTFAVQTALNVAKRGGAVVFFNLCAPAGCLAERLEETGGGALPSGLPLFFESRTANARRLEKVLDGPDRPAELVVVDDLQALYMASPGGRARYDAGRICRELKLRALRRNTAVLCLSRLSRGPDRRRGHRPRLTDIPKWDAICPWPDPVCLLCREGYYSGQEDGDVLEFYLARHTDDRVYLAMDRDEKGFVVDRLPY